MSNPQGSTPQGVSQTMGRISALLRPGTLLHPGSALLPTGGSLEDPAPGPGLLDQRGPLRRGVEREGQRCAD